MKNQSYEEIVSNYKRAHNKKLLIGLAGMLLGLALSATGVGAVLCVVCLILLIVEVGRRASVTKMRNVSLAALHARGEMEQAQADIASAAQLQLDGLTYACTQSWFCTGYGAIYPVQEIAWIFPFTHTVKYMLIPVLKMHRCKMLTLDGRELVAFYGTARDKTAFERLLEMLRSVNPQLQIGHSPEEAQLYEQRVKLHTMQKEGKS